MSAPWIWALDTVVGDLEDARVAAREGRSAREASAFPSNEALRGCVQMLSEALFPHRLGRFAGPSGAENEFVRERLDRGLTLLEREISAETRYWEEEAVEQFEPDHGATVVRHFLPALPRIRTLIDSDINAGFIGDPAARTVDEILMCYPGALASLHHRIAHELFVLGAPITARMISELANARTGIDIHPGATIGPAFFIDHGTGVVIGETAIVGAGVRLYQHVTLGAPAPLGLSHTTPRTRYARHPIVEDDVTIYAGATILGRVTIGRGSVIGANVWIDHDVEPASVVLQQPARSVTPAGRAAELEGI